MLTNHPSSALRRISAVAFGSGIVHVCQSLFGWFASVPWNHVGVGASFTHG